MESFFHDIRGIGNSFGVSDFLDILVVSYLLYHAIKMLRETRAIQLLKGIIILISVYAISSVMQLRSLSFLIRYLFQYGVFTLLVIFQPELRRSLEQVGRTRFSNLNLQIFGNNSADNTLFAWNSTIDAIGEAASYLSKRRIGALIVIERDTMLGEIIKTGTTIDCVASTEIIGNIFFPNSPLHDGAVIVRNSRLLAAGCYLPLSDNFTISKEMGTRHRAALGMSENSDAIVIIVSEETGVITIAKEGKLRRGFTSEQLVAELKKEILPEREEKGERKTTFFKVKK